MINAEPAPSFDIEKRITGKQESSCSVVSRMQPTMLVSAPAEALHLQPLPPGPEEERRAMDLEVRQKLVAALLLAQLLSLCLAVTGKHWGGQGRECALSWQGCLQHAPWQSYCTPLPPGPMGPQLNPTLSWYPLLCPCRLAPQPQA